MATLFPLLAVDGVQTLVVPGGPSGAHQLLIAAAAQPSAGTVTVEYRFAGETAWRALPLGASASLLSPIVLHVFGPVVGFRLTIAGIVGGTGLTACVADGEAAGLLPAHFTDSTARNSRLRVDVGQTGFFAGREFRTFLELNMTLAQVLVVKAVVPLNIVLFGLETVLTAGETRIETVVGGTEDGTFSTALPLFPRNTMTERPTPLYAPVVTLAHGGTHTGGTVIDLLLNKTADNANFAASVGQNSQDERGIGAGTYYFRITAVAAAKGTFKARWEERP